MDSGSPENRIYPRSSQIEGETDTPIKVDYFTANELRMFSSDDPLYENDSDDAFEYEEYDEYDEKSEVSSNVSYDPMAGLGDNVTECGGEICELHVYENRYNSKGQIVSLQVGYMDSLSYDTGRSPDAALILTRHYDTLKALTHTSLEIQSPFMKKTLKEVVKHYPELNLNATGNIIIHSTPRCLFHYRHELRAFADASGDDDIKEHTNFLMEYMERALRKEIHNYHLLMECNSEAPGLEYMDLWMAFRPGDLLYQKVDGEDTICRLRSMAFSPTQLGGVQTSREHWLLVTEIIECDGEDFGYTMREAKIIKYDGYCPLYDLEIFPLQYHAQCDTIKRNLLLRGNKYFSLLGVHHRYYRGIAELTLSNGPSFRSGYYPPVPEVFEVTPAQGRIIVDCKEFNHNIVRSSAKFIPGSKRVNIAKKEHENLSDEERVLCAHRIGGFSMTMKRWGWFKIRGIENIEFNLTAFESLVIPASQKELICSLVREHQTGTSAFDDIIQGKGKGLIFLLHGDPGVGKTLTAESISELTQRPLYILGCGDLGTTSILVEQNLMKGLALATKWQALVLIDEADVFLEHRNTRDLARNELVSVLLRVLEYFEGIMFLTTNRVECIDSAFKSRIHLSIYYPRLSMEARSSIWKVFIVRAMGLNAPAWLDRSFLEKVGTYDINGRQIKNIMRMACAIAVSNQRALEPGDIVKGLEALAVFETDFGASEKRQLLTSEHSFKIAGHRVQSSLWITMGLILSCSIGAMLHSWKRSCYGE